MAYFANSSEGMAFDWECAGCKYGDQPCPIAWVQMEYNYQAVGNDVASAILTDLVSNDGKCAMRRTLKLEKMPDGIEDMIKNQTGIPREFGEAINEFINEELAGSETEHTTEEDR